jgi:steroid delta-isomerase-like uncharacterized protein
MWATMDTCDADAFIRRMDALAAELPDGNAAGLFERASARDSFGQSDRAVPLYRAALAAGLSGLPRRRAIIQMASSLRNLGNAHDAVELLRAEADRSSDELDGAVQAFLALALTDVGHEREAVAVSLAALARYLPRYTRSLAHYAADLAAAGSADPPGERVMPQSANTVLARRWFDDVWNKRREATITEMLDPGAVGHLEGLVTHGIDEFMSARGYLIGAFPDLHISVEDTASEGDNVAIRWSFTGTHRGDNLGIPATGKAVSFRGITWFRFANGRLVEGWDSWNQGRLMNELQAAAGKAA